MDKPGAPEWINWVQQIIEETPEHTETALCWLYAKGCVQGMKVGEARVARQSEHS